MIDKTTLSCCHDELYHHGVLGMKWGIRKANRILGNSKHRVSKSKLNKLELQKKNAKKMKVKESSPAPKKTYKDFSDDELNARIDRLRRERDYLNLQIDIKRITPEKVSKGKKFAQSLLNDVIAPSVKDAGKSWLTKTLKDNLGINEKKQKTEYEKLKDKVDMLRLQKDYEDLKNNKKDPYKEMKTALQNYNTQQAYEKMLEELQKKNLIV